MRWKNEAYNAVTYFEVARRWIYLHCNMEVPGNEQLVTRTLARSEAENVDRNQESCFLAQKCLRIH